MSGAPIDDDNLLPPADRSSRSEVDDNEMQHAVQFESADGVDSLLMPAVVALLNASAESVLTGSAAAPGHRSRASSLLPSAPPSPGPRIASPADSDPSTASLGPASPRSAAGNQSVRAAGMPPHMLAQMQPQPYPQPQSPRRLASVSLHSMASQPSHASVPSSSFSKVRFSLFFFHCVSTGVKRAKQATPPNSPPGPALSSLGKASQSAPSDSVVDLRSDPRYRYQLIQKIGEVRLWGGSKGGIEGEG